MRFDDYEIVRYRPEFKREVAKLQRLLWGQDVALNASYLEWKHENNPYIGTPSIYVCLRAGQVVGMTAFTGSKWQIGIPSREFLIPCAGDSAIHPDHRSRGLFKEMNAIALNDLARDGYEYTFTLSTNPISMASLLMMGWRNVSFVEIAHWPANSCQASDCDDQGGIRSLARKIPFILAAYRRLREHKRKILSRPLYNHSRFFALDRSSAHHSRNGHSPISVGTTPRPEAMARLVERIVYDGRLRHVRDQEYFAWRFKNPRSEYRFLFFESATSLEGYLILQTSIYRDRGGINIVDWEATNPQVRAALLQTVIERGDFDSLALWSTSLSADERKLLQRFNFDFINANGSVLRSWPNLLIRPIGQNGSKVDWMLGDRPLLELDNWDLRALYSDSA